MPRSIWTGSISFGLVNIPVRMFSAIREHDVHFHQLAPDGSRIHYKRVSGKSGKRSTTTTSARATRRARASTSSSSPTSSASSRRPPTKTIDIEDFVPLDDIDPIYFERTYHLAPNGEGAAKAYALLAAVMEERSASASAR